MMKFMGEMEMTPLRVGMAMIFFTERMEMIGSSEDYAGVIKKTISYGGNGNDLLEGQFGSNSLYEEKVMMSILTSSLLNYGYGDAVRSV